jgi:hypothetical protein
VLYSKQEFDEWKDSINHVIARANREGRLCMSGAEEALRMLRMAEKDLRCAERHARFRYNSPMKFSDFTTRQAAKNPSRHGLPFWGSQTYV